MTEQHSDLRSTVAVSRKFESQLKGKRVIVRSLDWKQTLTGELVAIEKYLFVLRLDSGALMGIYKHSCGAIAPVANTES